MNRPRIVFFGSGYYVIPIVEKLREHGLALVVTTEPEGEFINYLEKQTIPFIYSKLADESATKKIKELKPTLGILASYGAIIPKKVIELFPLGIFNIHPSLLPKYKGPSPVQYAILNGDKITGTTIIKLDEQIDHGPILLQQKIDLNGSETPENLTEKLFSLGADMIIKIVRKIENGLEIEEKIQDHSREIFTGKISRQSGFIKLTEPPQQPQLDRMIRAFYPWPGVWFRTDLNGRAKIIKLFPEEKIQVEGKSVMKYQDFINGYGEEGKNLLSKFTL